MKQSPLQTSQEVHVCETTYSFPLVVWPGTLCIDYQRATRVPVTPRPLASFTLTSLSAVPLFTTLVRIWRATQRTQHLLGLCSSYRCFTCGHSECIILDFRLVLRGPLIHWHQSLFRHDYICATPGYYFVRPKSSCSPPASQKISSRTPAGGRWYPTY